MKKMKKILYIIASVLLILASCNPLDKENLEAISGEDVWSIAEVAEAYVNDIHASFMPGLEVWGFESANTDEAVTRENTGQISNLLNGTLTEDSYSTYPYAGIRRMNIFLEGIEAATFDSNIKDRLKGEVLFWRAWAYFSMVRVHGGVPLILIPEDPTNNEAIFVPRNKTSECFTQILKDLDEAIQLLGDPLGDGRIDKGAAMAFKGRVALFQASPQFNRSDNSQLWQSAYDANKAAVTYLDGQGKGLYNAFGKLWEDEMNQEVIMVKRYENPAGPNDFAQVCIMPLKYAGSGCAGGNFPSLELVDAFPMKDGSTWDADAMDYMYLYENRDDRFYATIAYNGAPPYLLEMFGKENLWTYWYDKDEDPGTGINGKEYRADFADLYESRSGFYPRKMVASNLNSINKLEGEVDWIEIRYAEVIMNLAEAANEVNKTDEALDVLKTIRERAGIEAGDGSYGITASSKEEVRQAVKDERFVEFAFEKKRFWDLRRWREYATTMMGLKDNIRHGLRFEWDGDLSTRPVGLEDPVTLTFSVHVIEDAEPINMLEEDKYSFFGLPSGLLERNSKLEQNNTWGGSFDPLQ